MDDPSGLAPEQLHDLGMALAQLEAAIEAEPGAFHYVDDHAQVVGDAAVFALAMKGFVVTFDPVQAAAIAAGYERQPEQGRKLLS